MDISEAFVLEDKINRPSHYLQARAESIELIEDLGWGPEFCLGNALKYLMRCQFKGSFIDDLKKARWYVNRVIEYYETISATKKETE